MKDTAPISEGIIAVAALFAIIAAGVAFVLYDYGLFGSAFIGGVIGVIAAIVLALGWRAPAPGPNQVAAPVAQIGTCCGTSTETCRSRTSAKACTCCCTHRTCGGSTCIIADGAPEFLSAAREGGPDDLKQIKGVGPKLEKTLHAMGIFHFDQIATWGPKEQAWIDDNLEGFKGRATRDNWVEQAKTLAAGGETEFSKKVDKGGVY